MNMTVFFLENIVHDLRWLLEKYTDLLTRLNREVEEAAKEEKEPCGE